MMNQLSTAAKPRLFVFPDVENNRLVWLTTWRDDRGEIHAVEVFSIDRDEYRALATAGGPA